MKIISVEFYRSKNPATLHSLTGDRVSWPSGLYSLFQISEVKVGRVSSYSGWVTSEA